MEARGNTLPMNFKKIVKMHSSKSEAIEWQRNISEDRESGLSTATFAELPAVPEDKAGEEEQFFLLEENQF